MRRADALIHLKGTYVGGIRRVDRVLTSLGVLDASPPELDRRLVHWAYSLTRVHNSLALAELGVPWWTYRAISAVDRWLRDREHPVRAFEYGSGASTVWLASRTEELHSVEHHRGFAEQLRPSIESVAAVDLLIVEPRTTDHPTISSKKEGHADLDFTEYVAAIDQVGGLFDLVVIDGRARADCLMAAVPHLEASGMIIFDNSWRRRYRSAIATAGLQERRLPGLAPTLPYPDQTSLLTRIAPSSRTGT